MKIDCLVASEPLGTAGQVGLAREFLLKDNSEDFFFVLNSDIVCQYDFHKMRLAFRESKQEAYLCVKEVEDPSQHGVVEIDLSDKDNKVTKYVDRPSEFVSNQINAGVYLFANSILDKIPAKPSSLECDILPRLADEGSLYAVPLDGYWMDVGLPHNYLIGTQHYLQHLADQQQDMLNDLDSFEIGPVSNKLQTGNQIIGNVLIHPSANVDKGAVLGPNVVIGEKCRIGAGCRISNSTILGETEIKDHAFIRNSIIGWQCVIGHWVRIEGVSVVAQDVQIKDEVFINESMILPHRSIQQTIPNAGTIVM